MATVLVVDDDRHLLEALCATLELAGVSVLGAGDGASALELLDARDIGLVISDVGMTPMDVIVATTKTAAECMGWEDRVGTLEAGKLADVVVSAVDPLTRIHDLANNDNIALVIKNGEIAKDRRSARVLAEA